jgi:hypothetical protein
VRVSAAPHLSSPHSSFSSTFEPFVGPVPVLTASKEVMAVPALPLRCSGPHDRERWIESPTPKSNGTGRASTIEPRFLEGRPGNTEDQRESQLF